MPSEVQAGSAAKSRDREVVFTATSQPLSTASGGGFGKYDCNVCNCVGRRITEAWPTNGANLVTMKSGVKHSTLQAITETATYKSTLTRSSFSTNVITGLLEKGRGAAFMTVLAVSVVLESTLAASCLSYKVWYQDSTVTPFDGFGGLGAVVAVWS